MSVYQEIRKSGSIRRGDRRRTKREAAKMGFSELKSQTGSAMEELSVELALKHIEEEMELEADRLAGAAKGKHCRNRTGKRHGYATGYVIMHGRKIQIDRPRVRSLGACPRLRAVDSKHHHSSLGCKGQILQPQVL